MTYIGGLTNFAETNGNNNREKTWWKVKWALSKHCGLMSMRISTVCNCRLGYCGMAGWTLWIWVHISTKWLLSLFVAWLFTEHKPHKRKVNEHKKSKKEWYVNMSFFLKISTNSFFFYRFVTSSESNVPALEKPWDQLNLLLREKQIPYLMLFTFSRHKRIIKGK